MRTEKVSVVETSIPSVFEAVAADDRGVPNPPLDTAGAVVSPEPVVMVQHLTEDGMVCTESGMDILTGTYIDNPKDAPTEKATSFSSVLGAGPPVGGGRNPLARSR